MYNAAHFKQNEKNEKKKMTDPILVKVHSYKQDIICILRPKMLVCNYIRHDLKEHGILEFIILIINKILKN